MEANTSAIPRTNRYLKQKVSSNFGYPPTYHGFLPIEQQIISIARRHDLNPASALTFAGKADQLVLPPKSEGLIAMPWWEVLAPTYGEAIQALCKKIAQSRKFYNNYEEQLSDRYVQLFEHTKHALETMHNAQKSDILVFPAQAGLQHKGESILYARDEFLLSSDGEFGGDPIMGLTILLNHPGRMNQFNEVGMDFPGVEYAPVGVSVFSESLSVYFFDARVRFVRRLLDFPYDCYGSVSGFLPQ